MPELVAKCNLCGKVVTNPNGRPQPYMLKEGTISERNRKDKFMGRGTGSLWVNSWLCEVPDCGGLLIELLTENKATLVG